MDLGPTPNFSRTPSSLSTFSRIRSQPTISSPLTTWARSLSGEHIQTFSTRLDLANFTAALAMASSASNSTIGQTTKPSARAPSSTKRELRKEFRLDALAGLVAVEEFVPKRSDHMVEGDGDVGNVPPRSTKRQHRAHEGSGRPHLLPLGVLAAGCTEIGAEELVGSVDEMDVHARTLPRPRQTGNCRPSRGPPRSAWARRARWPRRRQGRGRRRGS